MMTLVLQASAAGGIDSVVTGPSFACADPLFRTHWHTSYQDIGQLSSSPVAHTNLVRCRMWNYHPSCCTPSMEAPQQLAFTSRQAQFARQVFWLKAYSDELSALRRSEVYTLSDAREQVLLDRALEAFEPVFVAARACFRELLAFVAGMVCFSCNPDWDVFVWRARGGAVTAVNVSVEACLSVDRRCGAFGRAAQRLDEHIMASLLAKTPAVPLPDLSMFADRETVCDWLRSSLAPQPLAGAEPGGADDTVSTRRLFSLALQPFAGGAADTPAARGLLDGDEAEAGVMTHGPPYATKPKLALHPVRDGESSGFDLDAAATDAAAGGFVGSGVASPRGRRLSSEARGKIFAI